MTKVAIVTGGTRGIGEGICLALQAQGRSVVANYAGNEEKARAFTERTGIPAYKWDVGDHEATMAGCQRVAEEIGPIDIVVNNAGVTRDGVLHKMSWEDWNEVIRINLGGCFNLAKATFPGMRDRGWGRVVNIGSVNGQAGQYGQVNYAAAKAGLHGFSMSLAREVARKGVTVNSVSPGYVETPMTRAMPDEVRERTVASVPVGRIGQPADIARAVAFLTADDAGYITGANVPVNGGLFMSF